MKNLLVVILTLTLFGIAVLGVFGMGHGVGQGHVGCLAVVTKRIDCPNGANVLWLLGFHLDIFKSFSTAILAKNTGGLLSLFFILLLFYSVLPRIFFVRFHTLSLSQYRDPVNLFFAAKYKFTHWVSLHENSPAIFAGQRLKS